MEGACTWLLAANKTEPLEILCVPLASTRPQSLLAALVKEVIPELKNHYSHLLGSCLEGGDGYKQTISGKRSRMDAAMLSER